MIDATYEDAGVNLRFTSVVLMMLKILDKYNPYTRYKKDVVLKLKKDYSIDFYHLAKKSEKLGSFELTIDSMFIEFGLPESYRDLRNLKRRVLKDPIDEINKYTDIDLTYEPIKKGRSVVAFKFTVREKLNIKPLQSKGEIKTPLICSSKCLILKSICLVINFQNCLNLENMQSGMRGMTL